MSSPSPSSSLNDVQRAGTISASATNQDLVERLKTRYKNRFVEANNVIERAYIGKMRFFVRACENAGRENIELRAGFAYEQALVHFDALCVVHQLEAQHRSEAASIVQQVARKIPPVLGSAAYSKLESDRLAETALLALERATDVLNLLRDFERLQRLRVGDAERLGRDFIVAYRVLQCEHEIGCRQLESDFVRSSCVVCNEAEKVDRCRIIDDESRAVIHGRLQLEMECLATIGRLELSWHQETISAQRESARLRAIHESQCKQSQLDRHLRESSHLMEREFRSMMSHLSAATSADILNESERLRRNHIREAQESSRLFIHQSEKLLHDCTSKAQRIEVEWLKRVIAFVGEAEHLDRKCIASDETNARFVVRTAYEHERRGFGATQEKFKPRRQRDAKADRSNDKVPADNRTSVENNKVETYGSAVVAPSAETPPQSVLEKTDPAIQSTTPLASPSANPDRPLRRFGKGTGGVNDERHSRVPLAVAAEGDATTHDILSANDTVAALTPVPCRTSTALLGRQVLAPLLLAPAYTQHGTVEHTVAHPKKNRRSLSEPPHATNANTIFSAERNEHSVIRSPPLAQDRDVAIDYVNERRLMKSRAHLPPIKKTARLLAAGIGLRLSPQSQCEPEENGHVLQSPPAMESPGPDTPPTKSVTTVTFAETTTTTTNHDTKLSSSSILDNTSGETNVAVSPQQQPQPQALLAAADRMARARRYRDSQQASQRRCRRVARGGPSLAASLISSGFVEAAAPADAASATDASTCNRSGLPRLVVRRELLPASALTPPEPIVPTSSTIGTAARRSRSESKAAFLDLYASVPKELRVRMPQLQHLATQWIDDEHFERMRRMRNAALRRRRRVDDEIDDLVFEITTTERAEAYVAADDAEHRARIAAKLKEAQREHEQL